MNDDDHFEINSEKSEYSLIGKIFHWAVLVIFAYGIYKRVDEVNQLENFALLKYELIFAILFLVLLILRFSYMTINQKSFLPEETSRFQKLAARIVHLGMYISLAGIAVTGIIIGFLYWSGLKSGLVIEVVIALHELTVTVSYLFIGVHVAAAVFHRFKNDGVWNSMVPIWKEKSIKNRTAEDSI